MTERYKLTSTANGWTLMARKGAGAATEGAWVTLGGCPSYIVALRVYLALKAKGGR